MSPDPRAAEPCPPASSPAGGHEPAATLTTLAGRWELGWNPALATLTARHLADTADKSAAPAGTTTPGEATTRLGATPADVPTVGSLEERLGFPLPSAVRDRLTREQSARPAAAAPTRDFTFLQPDAVCTPVDGRERPLPGGTVTMAGSPDTTYAAALRHPAPLRVWEDGGFRLEILRAEPGAEDGTQQVSHRLSHRERVVFSGEDITAPGDRDVADDDAVRAIVGLLCRPGPDAGLTPTQLAFLAQHADTLLDLVAAPDPPYPAGTRVVVRPTVGSAEVASGVVVEALTDPAGTVIAYAWRPDAANVAGHPWHANPRHALVSPADRVSATLRGPAADPPGPSAELPPTRGAHASSAISQRIGVPAAPDPAGRRLEVSR